VPATRRPLAARTAFVGAWLLLCLAATWLIAADRLGDLEALGVPVMQPRFADVRPITGASVALDQQLDPLRANPGDPWERALNYPRIWLLPAMLGVGPEHSEAFAIVLLLLFAAGLLCLLPMATSRGRTALLLVALFSPVTWLAIERANNDVLVFALLAAAAWLLAHRPRTAACLIGGSAALKLYPIFAVGGLLGIERHRAMRLAAILAIAFVLYLLWIRNDLAAIRANSLTWNRISYGITQLPDALAANTGWSRTSLLVGCGFVVAVVTAGAAWARRRWHLPTTPGHTEHAFRIGAGVFVGTFCLGSNFDYRLLGLLLVLPQLADWCVRARGALRGIACTTALLVPALLWSMTWRRGLAAAIGSETPGLILDEMVTWVVLAGSITTLVLSLPNRRTTSAPAPGLAPA
jgi:hypothetical protein